MGWFDFCSDKGESCETGEREIVRMKYSRKRLNENKRR